jgi:hypothetical protein
MDETAIREAIGHLEEALRELAADPPDDDHALIDVGLALRALDRGIRGALVTWAPGLPVPAGVPAVAELDDVG